MKKHLILAGSCLLIATAASWAQPEGSTEVMVNSPNNLVWDLSAVPGLQTQDFSVFDKKTEEEIAHVMYDNAFTLSGSGKAAGAGQTDVTLDTVEGSQTFPADYKVKGSLTSSKGKAKGKFSSSATGMADVSGKQRKVKASTSHTFTIDNTTGEVAGTTKNSVSAGGVGSGSSTEDFTDVIEGQDGSWVLDLMDLALAENGKTINGTATVTLSSGTVLEFVVKGVWKSKNDTTKLVLTGTGDSKGSSLQVGMTGPDVTTIKGKILGQSVNETVAALE